MKISSSFHSGNIVVRDASNPKAVRLEIRPETNATGKNAVSFGWFHFRVAGAGGIDCAFRIENAGQSRWKKAWKTCRVVASYDRETWFRLPTTFDGKVLTIRHKPESDSIFYAYTAPYDHERRLNLIARAAAVPGVRLEVMGESIAGEDIELLVIGDAGKKKKKPAYWIVSGHHPGETQGGFAIEGLVDRLIDPADPVAREARKRAVFYVVPNINPDGNRLGNHRCNAAGTDLNRAWMKPSPKTSPEVVAVQKRMKQAGVDVCLDIHGDEDTPYVWPCGTSKLPNLSERQKRLRKAFETGLLRASPDFAPDKAPPGIEDLHGDDARTLCIGWTADTFDAFGYIFELPFEDNAAAPDPRFGWSPDRSRRFGAALLDALYEMVEEV